MVKRGTPNSVMSEHFFFGETSFSFVARFSQLQLFDQPGDPGEKYFYSRISESMSRAVALLGPEDFRKLEVR